MAIQLADLPLHMRKMIEAQHGIVLQGTPNKWKSGRRADLGMFFRSAWEANVARYLNFLKTHGSVKGWEYEPKRFEFPIRHGTNTCLPDFRVEKPDGSYEWWEVKGFRLSSIAEGKKVPRALRRGLIALRRMAKYYPDEKIVVIDTDRYREIARQVAGCIPYWE